MTSVRLQTPVLVARGRLSRSRIRSRSPPLSPSLTPNRSPTPNPSPLRSPRRMRNMIRTQSMSPTRSRSLPQSPSRSTSLTLSQSLPLSRSRSTSLTRSRSPAVSRSRPPSVSLLTGGECSEMEGFMIHLFSLFICLQGDTRINYRTSNFVMSSMKLILYLSDPSYLYKHLSHHESSRRRNVLLPYFTTSVPAAVPRAHLPSFHPRT